MSNMLRTLLRSTSDRQTDASNKGSMPSSPSFSDFSMGVGQEEMPTEDVHAQSLPSQPARGFWRRSLDRSVSLGSRSSSDSASSGSGSPDKTQNDTSSKTGRSTGMAIPQADRTFQNHFIPAAARQAGTPPADTKPPRQKYPEKKIDGMDYYEFCELIRSNSL
ncbi:hypothetical protein ABBQ32_010041 [Trebouxia sp. C0010 RCD-2024]